MQSSIVCDASRDVGHLTSMPFGDYAEPLAKMGFPVFAAVAGTHEPIGGEIEGTRDVEAIQAIAAHYRGANACIETSNFLVLEISGDAVLDALRRYLPFPDAPVSAIGNIRHVFFAMPGGVPSVQTAIPGVRIRSRGDYVLGPPSWLHFIGAGRWIRSPWDCWLMPMAPAWVIDLATSPRADVLRVAEAAFSAGGSHA